MNDPLHLVYLLAGVPVAIIVGFVVLWGVGRVVKVKLGEIEIVTVAELERYLDERMKAHETWEQKLSQTSRDVLRELIESYHRQGLDAVDQSRRLAVRVASDHQQLHEHLTALGRRVESLEKRVNHGDDT